MEQNPHFCNNMRLMSEPHRSCSPSYGPPYGGPSSHYPGVGLDETATLQAEFDALERERQILLLKQQRAAKRAELDRLQASDNVNTSAESSIDSFSLVSFPPPSSSSAGMNQRSEEPKVQKSYGFPGSHEHEQMPPPYSTTLGPVAHQTQHLPPDWGQQPAQTANLIKPIAIPATSAKLGSPFMRAYTPDLTSHGISRTDFLGFLDDLNRCAVASPPVQILGLVGNIVSFVPLQTAQIVGTSVNIAANVATYGVSKGRTEACLRAANRKLFAPRGLKAEIAKLSALAKIAEIPGVLDPVTGKVDKKASMLAPIQSLEEAQSQSAQHRRLQALERWIAPLDLAPLPEIKQSSNPLGKLHTMASERQRRKEEKKVLKGRGKALGELGKASREAEKVEKEFGQDMQELDEKEREVRLKEAGSSSKLEKKLAKIEKERIKLTKEKEKDMGKLKEDGKKSDKEEGSLRKILWLVVRNIEDSSGPGPNPDLESPGPSTLHRADLQ